MNIKIFTLIFFVYFYSEMFAGIKVNVIPKGTPQGAFDLPSQFERREVTYIPDPKPEPTQEPTPQPTTEPQPQEPEKKYYQQKLEEGNKVATSVEGLSRLVNHFTKSSGKTEDEVLQQCEDLLGYPKEMIEQYKAQKRLKQKVASRLSKTVIISCSDAIADFWNLNTMEYKPYKKEKLFQEISCQDNDCFSFNGVGSGKLLKILENQDMIQFVETINMFAFNWAVLFTYHKPLKKLTLHKSYTLGDMSSQVNIVWNHCKYKE